MESDRAILIKGPRQEYSTEDHGGPALVADSPISALAVMRNTHRGQGQFDVTFGDMEHYKVSRKVWLSTVGLRRVR